MASASARMSRQATRDTQPELRIRRLLHRAGYRYRVHTQPLPGLRRTADIVFTKRKVAVFVDGCFWHSCPEHATSPNTNADWWAKKLDRNAARDADTTRKLEDAGWRVLRIWEHEEPSAAVAAIEGVLGETERSSADGSTPGSPRSS